MDVRSRSAGFSKGTLLYMAPEQVQHKPVSPQSDIFSLGVVCYEALTRRQPFRGSTEEEVVEAIQTFIPPPASDINPAVGQTISRVVHKAMAKQPWNRYDSVKEFGDTLQKALRNEPIELFDPARILPRLQRASNRLARPALARRVAAVVEGRDVDVAQPVGEEDREVVGVPGVAGSGSIAGQAVLGGGEKEGVADEGDTTMSV